MADRACGHQQDLAGGAADLHGQVGIAAELAVALVDLTDGLDVEDAHHEGRAAGVVHGERVVAGGLRRDATASRAEGCRVAGRAGPRRSTSSGQTATASVLASRAVRQAADGGRFDFGVVVQEEDVLGIGRAPAEVPGLGQAEILGQADPLDLGKIAVQLRAAVGRAVVDDDDLEAVALLGGFQGFAGSAANSSTWLWETTTTETRGGCFGCSGFVAASSQ